MGVGQQQEVPPRGGCGCVGIHPSPRLLPLPLLPATHSPAPKEPWATPSPNTPIHPQPWRQMNIGATPGMLGVVHPSSTSHPVPQGPCV